MEGTRALILSKILGLIQHRRLKLTEAYEKLTTQKDVSQVLSDQLEKFYFWNGIFSKFNRHIRREERKPPNKFFHVYPLFFIYETLVILKEEYGYKDAYLSRFEIEYFLYLAQKQSDVNSVVELITAYRTDPHKESIERYLMERSGMDSRLYTVLRLCKHFTWTPEMISSTEEEYEVIKRKLQEFHKLISERRLIEFDEENPEPYYKLLYSNKSLLNYHHSETKSV